MFLSFEIWRDSDAGSSNKKDRFSDDCCYTYVPDEPSEEEEERDPVARLGAEIGDDLRDFRHTPSHQTEEATSK